jgi:adenylyl-sulfate kinase
VVLCAVVGGADVGGAREAGARAPGASRRGLTVWLTGLPGAGKSTIAERLQDHFGECGVTSQILDGDTLRSGLNTDLGFSKEDRTESIRRAGEVALLLASNGVVAIVSLVSPYAAARGQVRRRHAEHELRFVEVWLSAPLEVCEARDPKHLYARARRGEVPMMTGIDDPYEPPGQAELELPTHELTEDQALALLLAALDTLG